MITYTLVFPLMFASYQPPGYDYGVACASCRCEDVEALGVDWFYNWGLSSDCPGHIPMVWGIENVAQVGELSSDGWLLTINEPNYRGQAVASPGQVAAIWPQLEATGRKLVSPAVSACEDRRDPNCLDPFWLEKWVAACEDCRYEAVALHWFGCDIELLTAYLDRRIAQFPDKEIWLTEWACSPLWHEYYPHLYPTPEDFMRAALPEVRVRVDRYAWYATRPPEWYFKPLVDESGLTLLGEIYRSN
ncbi:MAG: glycosyl hydrolase [Planctomycetota bacterium]|jgi:hypothetical protein